MLVGLTAPLLFGVPSTAVGATTPSISSVASGPVTVGGTISDTATLSGATGTPDATTVTFAVYDAASDPGCATPLATLATASTGTSGGNPTYTSDVYTPT